MFENDYQEKRGDREVIERKTEEFVNSDVDSDDDSDNSDHCPLKLASKRARMTKMLPFFVYSMSCFM